MNRPDRRAGPRWLRRATTPDPLRLFANATLVGLALSLQLVYKFETLFMHATERFEMPKRPTDIKSNVLSLTTFIIVSAVNALIFTHPKTGDTGLQVDQIQMVVDFVSAALTYRLRMWELRERLPSADFYWVFSSSCWPLVKASVEVNRHKREYRLLYSGWRGMRHPVLRIVELWTIQLRSDKATPAP
jgi:hypothetical protein